jgi:hypothetical protein
MFTLGDTHGCHNTPSKHSARNKKSTYTKTVVRIKNKASHLNHQNGKLLPKSLIKKREGIQYEFT